MNPRVKKSLNVHLSSRQVHLNFNLLPNNAGHSRKYNLALYFVTCPLDSGRKYMLVLIEILLVPETRTSDFLPLKPEGKFKDKDHLLLSCLVEVCPGTIIYLFHSVSMQFLTDREAVHSSGATAASCCSVTCKEIYSTLD